MGRFVFHDKSDQFIQAVDRVLDETIANMAIDIERLSKMQVPVKTGLLRSSGHIQKLGDKKYRVIYNKEYALVRHEQKARKYTTPGTKFHYLIDPGTQIAKKGLQYFKEAIALRVKT